MDWTGVPDPRRAVDQIRRVRLQRLLVLAGDGVPRERHGPHAAARQRRDPAQVACRIGVGNAMCTSCIICVREKELVRACERGPFWAQWDMRWSSIARGKGSPLPRAAVRARTLGVWCGCKKMCCAREQRRAEGCSLLRWGGQALPRQRHRAWPLVSQHLVQHGHGFNGRASAKVHLTLALLACCESVLAYTPRPLAWRRRVHVKCPMRGCACRCLAAPVRASAES